MGYCGHLCPGLCLRSSPDTIPARRRPDVHGLIIVAISWFMEMAAEMRGRERIDRLSGEAGDADCGECGCAGCSEDAANTLAELVGFTAQNLSVLKTGKRRRSGSHAGAAVRVWSASRGFTGV